MPKVHYKVLQTYPNGGQDLEEIIDEPGLPYKPAWDEYEDIQRYILFTPEQLAEREKIKNTPTDAEVLKSQVTYLAMMNDITFPEV